MSGLVRGGGGDGGVVEGEWCRAWKDKFLGNLLLNGFQSDVTLVLRGTQKDKKEVGVHKIVLQCGSRVLHSEIIKGRDRLELDNVEDYASFMMMLKFLYTGTSGVTINEALPLLKMAEEFEVMELKEECTSLLKGIKLTKDNILNLFEDAMKFGHKDLIMGTLKFIGLNAHSVLNLPGFSNLRLDCLMEIIKQDDLRVKDEMEVFNAVYEWAKAECGRQGLDPAGNNEGIRIVVDEPLKYVRFPLMDKDQFVMNVATKNVLKDDEAKGLLMWFLASPENRLLLPQGRFISTPRQYFKELLGWGVSRRHPNIPLDFDLASTAQETLCFYVAGRHSLKLKEIVFHEEIIPSGHSMYPEKCGSYHLNEYNVQVETLLYEDDEEIMKESQPLGPRIPIVAILNPYTAYKIMINCSSTSVCRGYEDDTSCSYSPLKGADVGLRCALNFDSNYPAVVLDNKGNPLAYNKGIPLASPPFKIKFKREDRKDEIPITQGFIECLVFDFHIDY